MPPTPTPDTLPHQQCDPTTRREAFDSLVSHCTEPLYWHARRLVVVHEEAEDVVQESFIKAYNALETFRGSTEELRSWLYRIVTNTALSALRRRKRSFFTSLDSMGRELSACVAEEAGEQADQLLVRFQQAIVELPVKQKLVFNLRYYDQMPYAQIAQVLGQSEQTLKVNYHLAVKKIKQTLTR